ncbi:branched-chain amino acid ABC transporter permease [Actinocorallia sp. A-T 12471]|uniref:branched-chain amino acid ABC transporter permease n=1 Tax=Actinocorallia sp. A-T 12471 TaxID=3089813 RepID=UPI0029CF9284|nr:branched-chain amino acid ABC transporter permease [Actinocorallia sp. A-T 12471]MDX6744228.1 branched-chain amino acid ABC transporter permease [Actinocorallia sp. A-T 12471]
MKLLQLLLLGVSLGSIYALIALGFVVIYKGTKVINLAHGSVLLAGAYAVAVLSPHTGFLPALALGALVSAVCAALIERLVAATRSHDHLVLTILTIGVDILLATELARRIGSKVLTMGDPWGDGRVEILGTVLPAARLAATGVGVLLIAVFFLVFRRTDFGVRMRASADDPRTAALMGIDQRRVALASWAIGGALACVAGVFLAGFPNPGLDQTSGLIALNAIPAIIIGGLDSTEGAILGGLIVGVTQTLADGNASSLHFLGEGFGTVAPYVVMLAVLMWRPSGLLGSKELNRV